MTEPVPAASSEIRTSGEYPRRGFLYKAVTATIGAVVGLVPFVAGIVFFLDPLRKRQDDSGGGGGQEGFLKVGQTEAVPQDGTPVRFTVIVPRRQDAWTTYLNSPVGAIYVRRTGKDETGKDKFVAFNVTCPHLGCAVDYLPGKNVYLCPCHDSAFAADGKRTNQTPPRDLDTLELDADKLKVGEVWVKYQDFRTGEEHKVVKT